MKRGGKASQEKRNSDFINTVTDSVCYTDCVNENVKYLSILSQWVRTRCASQCCGWCRAVLFQPEGTDTHIAVCECKH